MRKFRKSSLAIRKKSSNKESFNFVVLFSNAVVMIYRFLKKYFTTAPIAFPLIGLFHLLITIIEAINFFPDPAHYYLIYSLRPVILAAYTTFWLACCYLKIWGALGYLFLTMANLSLFFFFPDCLAKEALGDILFMPIPLNLLFCFLILFYYKRMQDPVPKRERITHVKGTGAKEENS